MTDEQYIRLFTIALGPERYRLTRAGTSRVKWSIDDALQDRGYLFSAQFSDGWRRVEITHNGLKRLDERISAGLSGRV